MNKIARFKTDFTGACLKIAALLIALMPMTSCAYKPPRVIEQKSTKLFEEVLQDAAFIIAENNFRITGNLKIGSAIQQRNNSRFPLYEVIMFCNLSYAETMLSLDEHFIYYCPYKLSIREQEDEIIIGTALLPEHSSSYEMRKMAAHINSILRKIVRYAAEDDLFLMNESQYSEEP